MATAYYSTVFQRPADEIWAVIRDFNSYPVWVAGAADSHIEGGKRGDTVGAIRNVVYNGKRVRQRLLAHSDIERSQSYEFCDPAEIPVGRFRATLRVTPIVDGDRAFVEWWATFDCGAKQHDERTAFYRDSFATWLESLRKALLSF